MKIEVIRKSDDSRETLGKLIVLNDQDANIFECDTLELPYKNNEHQISCIPKGFYTCVKTGPSHIHYDHIAIENVPNRDGICIHKANFNTDLLGCIGVGNGVSDINQDGELDIVASGVTFEKLMSILPNEFKLTIK